MDRTAAAEQNVLRRTIDAELFRPPAARALLHFSRRHRPVHVAAGGVDRRTHPRRPLACVVPLCRRTADCRSDLPDALAACRDLSKTGAGLFVPRLLADAPVRLYFRLPGTTRADGRCVALTVLARPVRQHPVATHFAVGVRFLEPFAPDEFDTLAPVDDREIPRNGVAEDGDDGDNGIPEGDHE